MKIFFQCFLGQPNGVRRAGLVESFEEIALRLVPVDSRAASHLETFRLVSPIRNA